MEVKRIYFFLLITICLSLPLSFSTAGASQESILRVAQLDEVTGEVYVKKGGGLRDFPAYNGMSLSEGDLVQTHADSGVTITFEEDRTTLGEHTQVYLARVKNEGDTKETVLNQWSGQTWNNVKSLLNADDTHDVETPTSVMGVRGTLFLVNVGFESGMEELTVLEGLVETAFKEDRINQSGQNVAVSEQMNIYPEIGEREIHEIQYDTFVKQSDVRIIGKIYNDVLERVDDIFKENELSIFENTDLEMMRILQTLHSEMMLEILDEMTKAIERGDDERRQLIQAQLEERMRKSLEELKIEILEKRLRQIEQYESLRERAESHGVSTDALNAFLEQYGALEYGQQLADIRKELETRLQSMQDNQQNQDTTMINTNVNSQNKSDQISPSSVNNERTPSGKNNEPGSNQRPENLNPAPPDEEIAPPKREEPVPPKEEGEPEEEPTPSEEGEPEEEPTPSEEGEPEEEPTPSEEGEPEEEPTPSEEGEPEEEPTPSEEGEPEEEPTPPEEGEPEEEPTPPEEGEPEEEPTPPEEGEPEEEPTPPEEGEPEEEPTPPEEGEPEEEPTPPEEGEPEEEPTPPEEGEPEEEPTPPEEGEPEEEPTPPEEGEPEEEPTPPEEEAPEEEPTPPEEEEPVVTPPEVNPMEPMYLNFAQMMETRSIAEIIVDDDTDNRYRFTDLVEYDSSMMEFIFDETNTSFTIKAKTEGETEVTIQIVDEAESIEPITVSFVVYIESVLPDTIEISEAYRDYLMITYEHGIEGEQDDQLHISVKNDVDGYMNGWLINGVSLWPLVSTQMPDNLSEIEDLRVRYAMLASCSQNSFDRNIPNELCLDIHSIELFGSNLPISITPMIDDFAMKTEPANGSAWIARDFDGIYHSVVSFPPDNGSMLTTWRVTYERDGIRRTEDFRDYLIAEEIGNPYGSIFAQMLGCINEINVESLIPTALCTDVEGIKEITAVFKESLEQPWTIENEKNVPIATEILAEGSIIKLSFNTEPQIINRLFEVNTDSNTKMTTHPEASMEYYLYSDEEIHVSIDFIGVPIEIELEGSEGEAGEHIGSVEQMFQIIQQNYIDFWLAAHPREGYLFKHWLITWEDNEMIEEWEEINIYDYMFIDAEVRFKAVFEEYIEG